MVTILDDPFVLVAVVSVGCADSPVRHLDHCKVQPLEWVWVDQVSVRLPCGNYVLDSDTLRAAAHW
jgi:hypothetical protein